MAVDVEINASLNPDGTVRGLLEIEKETAETAKAVDKLQAKYTVLNDRLKDTDPRSKDWAKLYTELKKCEKELDDLANGGRAAAGSFQALEEELEDLQQQISKVAIGSEEFDKLSAKIRQVDGALATADEYIVGLSAEDKAGRIGQLAGGLGNVAASAALIGGEDSAIADFFGGLESAIGIMLGVQGAIESITAAKKLLGIASIQTTAATAAEATAMTADATATAGMTVATEAATVASWALNASLLANPVFWIVAVILAVVAAFAIFTAATKTASAEHDELNAQLERESQLIEANRKSRERANSEMQNEIANKQKLIEAEISLLQATGNRSKEQEARLKELKKQLGNIDEESLDILGTETQKRVEENTRLLHGQIMAAKKGVLAVYQEDWGAPDFDYNSVLTYFDDVDKLQMQSADLYQKANEATTEKERNEYIKRAKLIEDQVTQKTARILAVLEKVKGTLGDDASEEMQKVIDDIKKFGDRANESADSMSEFQKSIDNFSTGNMVEEFEKEQKAQEELERKREAAREKWKEFISQQKALREELRIARMTDQEREIYDLDKWFNERKKLTEKDAALAKQLQETYAVKKQEIADKYAAIEAAKMKERAKALQEIEQQIANDSSIIASMRLSAAVALAQEEADLRLEIWQKALEKNRAITDQELIDLKASLLARRTAVMESINNEVEERKKAAEIAKNEEIAAAEEKIAALQKNGLSESEAQKQLSDLKLSIINKYNAEVLDADQKGALDKRAAQKEYDDAELQAMQDQKNKLKELNDAHNQHLIEGLQKISAALDESVGTFEGALGKLSGAISAGVGNLGSALVGLKAQIADIKAKTKEGVELTPEEEQALKESTAQAVAAVVGAAGAVAQGIVDTIAEDNRAKAEQALSELEANKQRELDIVQKNLDAGNISQDQANKEKQAIELKAAQAEYAIKKKAFEEDKKAKIAAATIAGITGAVSAFAGAMQLGPIAGPIVGGLLAAAVGALTIKNIANIKKTQFGGSPPQPATDGGGGGGVPTAPVDPSGFLPTGSTSGSDTGSNMQQNGSNQTQSNQITVKAVVVETDVTSTQKQVSAIENRSNFN